MKKFFAMALMAFAALTITSCDSDDSELLENAIDKVLAITDSKLKSGSMPSVTGNVSGLTNTLN